MAADLYQELGVERGASADEIKQAYRRLAKQYHPDRNPDDKMAAEKFKSISHAYDVLKNDQSRAAYDRFGDAAFEQGQASGQNPFGADFGHNFSASMSDVFSDLFSNFMGGNRRQSVQRGEDLRHDVEISLEQAAQGAEMEFRIAKEESCAACRGSGAGKDSKDVSCESCHGHGVIRRQSGFVTFEQTCSACGGAGRMMSDPCHQCSGLGRRLGQKKLKVKIPAGIGDETQMRLKGRGNAGLHSAPAGDLYLFIHIAPHDIFMRDGHDLFCTVPVSMPLAALGGEVSVPTLSEGRISVKIPEGCQTGKRLRVRGQGIRGLREPREGDLFIDIHVETPVRLDDEQRILMEKLRDSLIKKNTPHTNSFAETVHNIFDKLRPAK